MGMLRNKILGLFWYVLMAFVTAVIISIPPLKVALENAGFPSSLLLFTILFIFSAVVASILFALMKFAIRR